MTQYKELMDIPEYPNWKQIIPIRKGWSSDTKYYIESVDGRKYLLRLSDSSLLEQKRTEYETVERISALGLNMSLPVGFGICSDGQAVYSLLSWVEGADAETRLPELTEQKQYELGINAGRALRKIHTMPAPSGQPPWDERFNRKIDRNISRYQNCGVAIPHDEKIVSYIEDHRHLLAQRPQTLQHGDFHVGNFIITPDTELAVIDFNRYDFGDPWEEYNRIVWSVRVSRPFANGQIHGYFDNSVPDAFFRLMALYIASNTLSAIPWAIPYGEDQVKIMLRNAAEMLEYYSTFETTIPLWYF